MKHVLILVLALMLFSISPAAQLLAQDKQDELVLTARDKEIVDTLLIQLKKDQKLETGFLIIKIGKLLLETPYVANTLETGGNEKMVINLRGLDCTTFAENCLALARTIQNDHPTFYKFVEELKYIRYRDGLLNEYPSRLHYFSDWIYNNDKKKTVKSISSEFGNIPLHVKVSFMSKHPELYPALKNNPEFVRAISLQEDEISNRKTWYIPKNRFTEFEHLLHDGDIIGITTNMPGMDVSHVVIAIHKEGRIHIIHASLKHKKVIISTETLEQYLRNYKSITGIMVARPL